jgi:hypothetical protein
VPVKTLFDYLAGRREVGRLPEALEALEEAKQLLLAHG